MDSARVDGLSVDLGWPCFGALKAQVWNNENLSIALGYRAVEPLAYGALIDTIC